VTALLGHDGPGAAFLAAMRADALHHAWLLAGPRGVGKAGFARAAALRLLAGDLPPEAGLDVPEDHPAARLAAADTHPDLRTLARLPKDPEKPDRDLARAITVAQVRSLGQMLATSASMGGRRVIVLDAADDLERSGANALLKSLEEPPAGAVFLLVSHAPGRLLPTIRSRCRLLRFDALGDADMDAALARAAPDATAEERAALVRAGGGSPGRAMRYAGLDVAGIDRALAEIAERGDADNTRRSALSEALAAPSAQPRYEAFLDRAPASLAAAARRRTGLALKTALDGYAEARDLARTALAQSLDPRGTVFEMAGIVARLASRG